MRKQPIKESEYNRLSREEAERIEDEWVEEALKHKRTGMS